MNSNSNAYKKTINKIYSAFFSSFTEIIKEELSPDNRNWRQGQSLTFFRENYGRYSRSYVLLSDKYISCFNSFKKSITKQDIITFISSRSLNKRTTNTWYSYRKSKLSLEDLSFSNGNALAHLCGKIEFERTDKHICYAENSIVEMFQYMMKYDRKLLNLIFTEGCDFFVRYILENHTQFLTKKALIKKLDLATTDKLRTVLLTNIKNKDRKYIINWVNKKGGVGSLTQGLRSHILYELKYNAHEFKSPEIKKNKENQSNIKAEDVSEIREGLNSVKKSLRSLYSAVLKSDKILNSVLFNLIPEMDTVNSKLDEMKEKLNNKELEELGELLSNSLSSSSIDLSRYDFSIIANSVMYLPKEYSLFYMASVDTINKFSCYIQKLSYGDWSYDRGAYLDSNSFGRAILNSNIKML